MAAGGIHVCNEINTAHMTRQCETRQHTCVWFGPLISMAQHYPFITSGDEVDRRTGRAQHNHMSSCLSSESCFGLTSIRPSWRNTLSRLSCTSSRTTSWATSRQIFFLECCDPETYSLQPGLLAPCRLAQAGLTEIFTTLGKSSRIRTLGKLSSFSQGIEKRGRP